MAFADYQNETYLNGLGGVLPAFPIPDPGNPGVQAGQVSHPECRSREAV